MSQLSFLPPGWATVLLEDLVAAPKTDIVDGPFGSNLKASEYLDEGVPIIRLQNVKANLFIEKNIRFVSQTKAALLKRHSFKAGDIVISKLGDPLGEACIVPDTLSNGLIVADVVRIRVVEGIVDKRAITYALNSDQVQQQLKALTKGTTRPRVNLSHIRAVRIPLPPGDEQRRLVAEIEKQFTRLDAAVAALKRVQANLKRYRAAVLMAACEGRLVPTEAELAQRDNQSSHRQPIPVGSFLSEPLVNGRSPATQAGGAKILRLTAIQQGGIDFGETRFGDLSHDQRKRFTVHSGDIFVSRGSGSIGLVGRAGMVDQNPTEQIAFPDTMIRIRLDLDRMDPHYFVHVWNSRFVRDQIERIARTTAGIHKISQTDIERIVVPAPPVEMQQAIVSDIERRLSVIEEIERLLAPNVSRGDQLRQSILKRAFEGKLVPQDPSDEPASVLLERIRAERAALASVTSKPSVKRGKRVSQYAS